MTNTWRAARAGSASDIARRAISAGRQTCATSSASSGSSGSRSRPRLTMVLPARATAAAAAVPACEMLPTMPVGHSGSREVPTGIPTASRPSWCSAWRAQARPWVNSARRPGAKAAAAADSVATSVASGGRRQDSQLATSAGNRMAGRGASIGKEAVIGGVGWQQVLGPAPGILAPSPVESPSFPSIFPRP